MFPSIVKGKNNIACAAQHKALNRVPYILLEKKKVYEYRAVQQCFLKKVRDLCIILNPQKTNYVISKH